MNAQGSSINVGGDSIYAITVTQTGTTLLAGPRLNIIGTTYNATDAAVTIGSGSFSVSATDSVLSSEFTLNAVYQGGLSTLDFNNTTLDITALNTATINLDTSAGFPVSGSQVALVSIADVDTREEFISKLRLNSNNGFSRLSLDPATGHVIHTTDTSAITSPAMRATLDNTATREVLSEIGLLPSDKQEEALARSQSSQAAAEAGAQAVHAVQSAATLVSSRVNAVVTGIALSSPSVTSTPASSPAPAAAPAQAGQPAKGEEREGGVASGDAADKFGIWANVIGSVANQEKRKSDAGFRSTLMGGMVGADTMLNEDLVLGFAVGNAVSNAKYKDVKKGDKALSNSWMFAGYGNYNIDNNWFVRGSFVAGSNKVTSKELRLVNTGASVVTAKYNMETYGLEAVVGYNYRVMQDSVVTPSLGVRGTYLSDISYAETGATAQARQVTQKANTSGAVIGGVQFSTIGYINETQITPEAHVNLQYGLGVKSPKGHWKYSTGVVENGGTGIQNFSGTKPAALSTTFGSSVTTITDNVEYGAGYDLTVSDKYIAHQGSVKVKVMF